MAARTPMFSTLCALVIGVLAVIPSAGLHAQSGPFAVVEDIQDERASSGNTPLQFMDYVRVGQVVDLRRRGVMVLAHLDGCTTETFRGGVVRIGVARGGSKSAPSRRSKSKGGTVKVKTGACQSPTVKVSADAREAGATVNRVTPFVKTDWAEITIVSARPIFKWSSSATSGPTTVRLFDVDRKKPVSIWRQSTRSSFVRYPANGPKLIAGRPYVIEIKQKGGPAKSRLFSIDPHLDVTGLVARRVVAFD